MKLRTILGACLILATAASAHAETTKIRTTIPANSMFFLPQFVAETRGLFKEAGLETETIITSGDGPDVDALIAGSVEFTLSTPNRLLTAYQQGRPLLAVMSLMDRVGVQCFMNKETAEKINLDAASSAEERLAKLNGLVIAGTRPGAFTYLLAVDYLKRARLTPQKDARIISIGNGPGMIAAVENKQADMGCFGSPIVESAVSRGKSVWFINNTSGDDAHYDEFLFQVVYVRPEYAKENPEIVKAYVGALLKASEWLATAPKEDVLPVLKERFSAIDDAILLEAFENVRGAYSTTGTISEKTFNAVARFLRDTDMLAGDVPWDAVTTNDYLPKR